MERRYQPYRSFRSADHEVLEAIYDISLTPLGLLRFMAADGYTNNQIAKEMNYRGHVNPRTNRPWTPIAVKSAITKDPKPPSLATTLGPILGPKTKEYTVKEARKLRSENGGWLSGKQIGRGK